MDKVFFVLMGILRYLMWLTFFNILKIFCLVGDWIIGRK